MQLIHVCILLHKTVHPSPEVALWIRRLVPHWPRVLG